MSESSTDTGLPECDVDAVLRRFYRSEMPAPWPVLKPPQAHDAGWRTTSWWRVGRRLVLSAAGVVLFAGYLSLAGRFHDGEPTSNMVLDPEARIIGQRPRPILLDTPRGAKALSWEQKVPDGEVLLMQEVTVPKKR